jgi:hypothetical protein
MKQEILTDDLFKFDKLSGWHDVTFIARKTTGIIQIFNALLIRVNISVIIFAKLYRENKLQTR